MRVLLILALVLVPIVAAAEPMDPPLTGDTPQRRDPGTATAYAVGATGLGVGMMMYGVRENDAALAVVGAGLLVVGPALGHFYAREYNHAAATTLVRGLAGLVWVGAEIAASHEACASNGEPCGPPSDHHVAHDVAMISAGALIGTAVYDLFDAHRAAERTNRRPWYGIGISPLATGGGLVVAGRF
jgi:hypothetical protein